MKIECDEDVIEIEILFAGERIRLVQVGDHGRRSVMVVRYTEPEAPSPRPPVDMHWLLAGRGVEDV